LPATIEAVDTVELFDEFNQSFKNLVNNSPEVKKEFLNYLNETSKNSVDKKRILNFISEIDQ